MSNIFEDIVRNLNRPLVEQLGKTPAAKSGAGAKKEPAAKAGSSTRAAPDTDAKAGTQAAKPAEAAQAPAPDIQADLRARDAELKAAQVSAENAAMKKELEALRAELHDLRRQYETEMARQAETHAKTDDWTYTVVRGDTLSHIAQRFYGSAARWPEIFEANKDTVKKPQLIYPGQVLVIPNVNAD